MKGGVTAILSALARRCPTNCGASVFNEVCVLGYVLCWMGGRLSMFEHVGLGGLGCLGS